jgi:probable O-glycosylation ligase (exosortase A-associated)
MKQTAVMLVLLLFGTVGPITSGPFVGVAIYYLFAVLRPQYIWEWALPGGIGWSYYVAVATLMATGLYFPRNLLRKNFTATHIAVVGFAVCVTLSNVFAIKPDVSSYWYWEYAKIFIMFFCATFVVNKLSHVRILYVIALGALAYIAYEMNSVYLFDKRLDIYFQGFGGLDNNGAGLMIAMGIPMAYFLWQAHSFRHRCWWWRWILLAIIPVMLHAVLLSYSRGAMVALLLTVPLLVIRSLHNKGRLILFSAIMILLVPILAGREIRDRFFSTEKYEEDRSAQSRFESWNAGWSIAKDHPIIGVGLRNSDLLSRQYGADSYGRTIHSQYLQIAADCGFPAIGFYLLTLFGAWRSLGRSRRQSRSLDSEENYVAYNIASGIEGAISVFCIGALFLSLDVFELPYLLILLALKLPLTLTQERSVAPPVVAPIYVQPATSYSRP